MFGEVGGGGLYRYLDPGLVETFCFPISLRCGCLFSAR